MIHSIYKITHLDSGRCYIGYSKDYQKRWETYFSITKNTKSRRQIDRAIAKYGQDAFTFEVIYQSTDRDHTLNEMESFFIEQYDSIANGFNMRRGGTAQPEDFLHTDEIRKKISDRTKEGMKNGGSQKISAAQLGRKHTTEHIANRTKWMQDVEKFGLSKAKKSSAMKDRWADRTEAMVEGLQKTKEALVGRALTSEHRQRISQSNRSSVVWILRYDGKYHWVNGDVNSYVNQTFPFSHSAIRYSMKNYYASDEWKDKTKIVYGAMDKGSAKGFEVTRLPEKFMAGQHEKLSWIEAVERANYLIQNGYAKGDVAELAKVLYENANK